MSFKTALDLGRPVWKWNFNFDIVGFVETPQ